PASPIGIKSVLYHISISPCKTVCLYFVTKLYKPSILAQEVHSYFEDQYFNCTFLEAKSEMP
ncbi:MAG TPA: hypothetical protein PLV47_06155, partial [Flavobacterium sp.]|nr:hypothetical protein [Flavobacterium sp.]